jgi:alanyl aminopeptidase
MTRLPSVLVVFLAIGSAAAAASEPDLTPPGLRLPDVARPVRQALDLTIVPTESTFTGIAAIDLTIARPTRVLWLNAERLEIAGAEVTAGGATSAAKVVPGGDGYVGFLLPQPIAAGPATLRVRYRGELSRKDASGLFVEKDGADTYAFTQFEHMFARRAFPCFDEPAYKIPWRLTLHVPKDEVAVGNSPVEREIPGTPQKTVVFAETKPLPSYLVALAVGPLAVLDAGKTKSGVPLRVIAPRGLAEQTGYARQTFAPIMDALEAFLSTPYPYPKLDLVAVPQMSGAMENAGLITSIATLVLRRPGEEDVYFRRLFLRVIAHEGGHQWFGDLVTMAWWDDLWLNEAFAEWIEVHIADVLHPEWRAVTERLGQRNDGLEADAQIAARRIRQPIERKDDIANAFDSITYHKGSAVLHMFERWVGADVFRAGVHAHFARHAHGTATSADFLAAIGAAAGRDVAPAFATFLDANGAPELDVTLACTGGRPTVTLAQRRYLPRGSKGNAAQTWKLPVCLRWGVGGAENHRCQLLETEAADVALDAQSCPDWLVANADSSGYYVPIYDAELTRRLLAHTDRLTSAETEALLEDAARLTTDGRAPARTSLELAARFAEAEDPVLARIAATTANLEMSFLIPDAAWPAYRRYLLKAFGPRARALGWTVRAGDDEDTRLLRAQLLWLVAGVAEEPELVGDAGRRAGAWLDGDRAKVAPDVVDILLPVAAHAGDRALFERARRRLAATTDPIDRMSIILMLASFRTPKLADEALALGTELDPREGRRILSFARWDRVNAPRAYAYVRDHFDELAKNSDDIWHAGLVSVSGFCDADDAARIVKELGPRAAKLQGGTRVLAKSVEKIELCAAARAYAEPELTKFLSSY